MHGGDFTITGPESHLDWFREQIIKRFEVKFKARLGPDSHDDKKVRVLNRIIEWENGVGIKYEADQRHAEIIVEAAGLQNSNSVSTPGVKEVEVGEGTPSEEGTNYRAIAARANYLAQDRIDIQFAAKELSRNMSNPDVEDWRLIKRLGRYLKGEPRIVQVF